MTDETEKPNGPVTGGAIGELWRRDGWPAIVAAVSTLVIELGVYGVVRMQGVGPLGALLAALFGSVVWVILASGIFASGASTGLGALLRGGIIADTSAVTLLVLWLVARDIETGKSYLTFLAAAKVYCTLALLAVASVAVVWSGRSAVGRYRLAVCTVIVLMIILAGPFWIGGLLEAVDQSSRGQIVTVAVYANPFYSVASAIAEETEFVWHLSPVMYRITRIGSDVPVAAPSWYAATVVYACIAGIACGTRLVKRRA